MGYGGGGGGGGGGGSGGSGGGSGASGGSGYRRVGDDRTANLKVDNITNRDGSGGTEVDGIVEVNTTAHFIPPSGTTAERGSRGRGVIAGGTTGSAVNTIQYVTIATTGNSSDFGDLSHTRYSSASVSSSTRGVVLGGTPGSTVSKAIYYMSISSTGNAFDFGDMTDTHSQLKGVSDEIRGVVTFGSTPVSDTLEFITIASKGNSSIYGGKLTVPTGRKQLGTCSSPTRGLFAGGRDSGNTVLNSIDYITIQTQGNAQDFGDLVDLQFGQGGCSSNTRGIFAGGKDPAFTNRIDYVTLASLGDAIDFGDLARTEMFMSGTSNGIRGIFAGGVNDTPSSDTRKDSIDYITIASKGNAADFGNLLAAIESPTAFSDSHGGLG